MARLVQAIDVLLGTVERKAWMARMKRAMTAVPAAPAAAKLIQAAPAQDIMKLRRVTVSVAYVVSSA